MYWYRPSLRINLSVNLLNWKDLPWTSHKHYAGDVLTLNGSLTAIGGEETRKVEVYQNGQWDENVIPEVGNVKRNRLHSFTSLAIGDELFVFGKIKLIQNT